MAAHLDHGLRADSPADAEFCGELCRRLGVPLHVARADVRSRARREGGGIEEAARGERYAFLRGVKEQEGATAIAVAHTLDDQAETFLLRLLRGSGRTGMACMRPVSGDLLRPLLGVSRREVLAHLRARGLAWREDPTNSDLALLRNRVRGELIPYLEAHFNPRTRETLARQASLVADEADLLEAAADEVLGRAARQDGETLVLSTSVLGEIPSALARIALRQALERAGGLRGVTATHVERLLRLVVSPSPSGRSVSLPAGREGRFHFGDLRIGRPTVPARAFALPLSIPGKVELPSGLTLVARAARGRTSRPAGEAALVSVPAGPLMVRTRRPGDRVLFARREVSLRRFLMDRRVPADLRAALPLVAVGDRVVWVAGQPMDPPRARGERLVTLQLSGPPSRA